MRAALGYGLVAASVCFAFGWKPVIPVLLMLYVFLETIGLEW
jgi:hypothetical protein